MEHPMEHPMEHRCSICLQSCRVLRNVEMQLMARIASGPTNPHGPLWPSVLLFYFQGEIRRVPAVFAQKSESKFQDHAKIGQTCRRCP